MVLLIDSNYLCHRSRHTTGFLSHEEQPVGTIYGILRDIRVFRTRFGEDSTFVWAWDHRGSLRRNQIYPRYKQNRKKGELTKEQRQELDDFYIQIRRLKSQILPQMGFKNVFSFKGYEADDIIAKVCSGIDTDCIPCVIVSADTDLWQCLRDGVSVYNPTKKEMMTARDLRNLHGVEPRDWVKVKALTGDTSDGIPGIMGVGPNLASQAVRGKLKTSTKAHKAIMEGSSIFGRNIQLMNLPLPGLPQITIEEEDEVTEQSIRRAEISIGMRIRRRKPKKETAKGGFDV